MHSQTWKRKNRRLNGRLRTGTTHVVWHNQRLGSKRSLAKDGCSMGTTRTQRTTLGVTTALTLLLAGVDLFMMMHPAAVKTLKDVTNYLTSAKKADRQNTLTGHGKSLRSNLT